MNNTKKLWHLQKEKIKNEDGKLIENPMILNNQDLWAPITLSSEEIELGIEMGTRQESESEYKGLKDRSFSGSSEDSLKRSIAAKQFEFAIRRWGGGTAKVVEINCFHDQPDVGQCNARFTFDPGYGLMITKRDQGLVPMILGTGKCPNFYLMGWLVPDFERQKLIKVHQGRNEDCESNFGFLQQMKDHEAFQINMQMLLPMHYLNKELVK